MSSGYIDVHHVLVQNQSTTHKELIFDWIGQSTPLEQPWKRVLLKAVSILRLRAQSERICRSTFQKDCLSLVKYAPLKVLRSARTAGRHLGLQMMETLERSKQDRPQHKRPSLPRLGTRRIYQAPVSFALQIRTVQKPVDSTIETDWIYYQQKNNNCFCWEERIFFWHFDLRL